MLGSDDVGGLGYLLDVALDGKYHAAQEVQNTADGLLVGVLKVQHHGALCQQVIADAGYIPYRRVEGLTLPEPTTKMLYTAVGTSGVMKPDETADYYYQCNSVPDSFTAEGLDEAVAAFIADAEAELALLDMEEMQNFVRSRFPWGYASEDIVVRKTLIKLLYECDLHHR